MDAEAVARRSRSARTPAGLERAGGARDTAPESHGPESMTMPDPSMTQHIDRPRVSARIEQLTHRRAAEVTGPAGSGKTTAVKMWASATHVGVVAWLTVRAEHRDTLILAHALVEALRSTIPLGNGTSDGEPMDIVDSFGYEMERSGRRVVVVIDNVEKLAGAPSLDVVRRLVSNERHSLRLIATGRAIPDIGFEELRRSGELVTVGKDLLRLTADETSRILHAVSHKQLDDDSALAIHEQLGGWAMGAVLAGSALSTSPTRTMIVEGSVHGHRLFGEYFGSQVFDELANGLQAFLLETSVLDVLDPVVCAELTGRSDAEQVLWSLERTNLFTEWLGGRPPEFRYHSMLRSWLRERLRRTQPSLRYELLERAAAWYRSNGRAGDAIAYWLAANDHHAAAESIVAYGPQALSEGRYEATRTWISALPDRLVTSSAPLLKLLADAEHRLGNAEGATAAWALMRELVTRHPELGPGHELTVMAQRGTELHRRGHLLTAAAHARRSAATLDLSQPLSGAEGLDCEDPDLAMNVASLASQMMFSGHWSECARLSRWVVDSCPANDPTMATVRARCLGQEAIAELVTGSRIAAEALALDAIAVCRFYDLDPLDLGYAELALIVAGRDIERSSLHANLERRAAQLNAASHTCLVGLARAWAYVQTGDLEDARRMLAVAENAMTTLSEPGVLVPLTKRIRTIVDTGTDEPILRPRELDVLRLIAAGMSRRQVAEQLHLSLNTVKTYARHAYRALDVTTKDDAIARCEALGIRLGLQPEEQDAASIRQ